jgi:glycerol-3-phosphate dehydrogenase (NAD+)
MIVCPLYSSTRTTPCSCIINYFHGPVAVSPTVCAAFLLTLFVVFVCVQGMDFDDKGAVLLSDVISKELQTPVAVLCGANVADDVGRDQFCEATVGTHDQQVGQLFVDLFDTATFKVATCDDPAGVEVCGALKNIVAVGAGFVDGIGMGTNTKAAIIRIGLMEMLNFSKRFFHGVKSDTFFESCGVADLVTTCFGGRNRKCAEAFVKTGKSWEVLEEELLGGQKLQGTLTAKEVHIILERTKTAHLFPFFEAVYSIAYEGVAPEKLVEMQLHVPREEHWATPGSIASVLPLEADPTSER